MIYKIVWVFRACFYSIFFKKIGLVSYMGKPIYLHGIGKVSLGKKVRIFPGMRLEVHGEKGELIIGDNVGIGHNFFITSSNKMIIGNNVTISGSVHITDAEHNYGRLDRSVLQQGNTVRQTAIGDNSFIGYGAFLQAGTMLGKNCIVGANSVVKGNFPDNYVIAGAPAKIIKKYNPETRNWEKTDSFGGFKSFAK